MLTSLFVFLLLVISTANHHSGGNMISKILKEKIFEPFVLELGLHQLISEQTHFMGDSKSCIDLISLISLWTNQPNLIMESGVHPSLHEHCHHQIIYGKFQCQA